MASSPDNPIVFFDISIGTQPAGRIKFELFANICPKTSENFRQLCTGEYRVEGKPMGYKNCKFHRIIKDFMVQGGDYINVQFFNQNDGSGNQSIYGPSFPDENFILKHSSGGLLSMANNGKDANGSQFFITCKKAEFLDGKHVVFGRVVDGLVVMKKIENVPTSGTNNVPKVAVTITECGEL
jgi:peptidyl-prolyl isomerase H (cyclophilin H)